MALYRVLDVFFLVFHTTLILFNLFGWIWKYTRKINLVCLLLTAASWGILGIFYGFGFCPLTEWHFSILEKLGHFELPYSYIKYLADRITGIDFSQKLVDSVTLWGLIVALFCSLLLNFKARLFSKKSG